jgi:uncharacterized alkaline shock family protein YloU
MHGTVHISQRVLATLVELTALSTPGVAKVYRQSRLTMLRSGGQAEGVTVSVEQGAVHASVSIVVEAGSNMLDIGRAVQRGVARALHDMAGMEVREVNVNIQDVEETP